ncbi:hypothetical protein C8Q70DRAFT_386295 [Cubamyces menziesii]|nr:hypothetical protein C8Q70DRAFT_386295 [Cubamyces menziesii]
MYMWGTVTRPRNLAQQRSRLRPEDGVSVCVPRLLALAAGSPSAWVAHRGPSSSSIALSLSWCVQCIGGRPTCDVRRSTSSEKRHRGNVNLRRDRSPASSDLSCTFLGLFLLCTSTERHTLQSCHRHRTRSRVRMSMSLSCSARHTPLSNIQDNNPSFARSGRIDISILHLDSISGIDVHRRRHGCARCGRSVASSRPRTLRRRREAAWEERGAVCPSRLARAFVHPAAVVDAAAMAFLIRRVYVLGQGRLGRERMYGVYSRCIAIASGFARCGISETASPHERENARRNWVLSMVYWARYSRPWMRCIDNASLSGGGGRALSIGGAGDPTSRARAILSPSLACG